MVNKTLIGVYGTLKRGQSANYKLDGSKFIASDKVPGATMYNLGAYPAVIVDESNNEIHVEVYEVDDNILKVLDQYEGYPDLYGKTTVSTSNGREIIIYTMDDVDNNYATVIEGGIW